jgi:hypothetical protein
MTIAFINKVRKIKSLNFLYKLFIFILIVFIFDFTIGSLLKYYYFKQSSGFYYRTTYSIEKTKADILIFGTSKANHQYSPEIIESRLKLTYYNVGRDGSSIFYHYAVLKSVLKRYNPKVIILDITEEFEKTQTSYDRISMLLPYYEDHTEIRPIIELKSQFEKIKLLSKLYPYNSLVFSILAGNTEFNKSRHIDNKGYVPMSKVWNASIQHYSVPFYDEIDSTKVRIFESFIKDCKNSGIKLYIVASPNYYTIGFINKSNLIAKEIAQKYKIKFLDHSSDSLFLNNNIFFADPGHLNNKGAIIFSNIIVDEIIQDFHN